MSQDELAKNLNVHGAVIGLYERDEVKPSIEMTAAIAEALKISRDYSTYTTPAQEVKQGNRLMSL